MEHGVVRTILLRHAQPQDGAAAAADPNALVDAARLRGALEARDAGAQRALAADYVALWARTFRTLVRHLRGRPDRALALFAEEVYPFLRGDRRAARIEPRGPRQARLLLAPDLPAPYLAGLVSAFVGLSGAQVRADPVGDGAFDVSFRLEGATRVAHASQALAALRLPLLLAALLAAAVGLAFADRASPRAASAVLLGVVAAQAAANLLHAARRGPRHPFAPALPSRRAAATGSIALYLVAAACAAWLAFGLGRTGVLAFAAVGLALGVTYAGVRERGLGPAVAGLTFGLLVPAGAAYAADPGALAGAGPVWLALAGAPLGFACAAQLFLDNLADRPLDEAGGQRTLAVRLPGHRHVVAFAVLLGGAALAFAVFAFPAFSPLHLLAALLLAVAAARLAAAVRRHHDDPHDLAPTRLATIGLMAAVGAFQAWWLVGA